MISNLEYLKVFYYVAKAESVSKAAETLAISQPAVSQALRQLERSMNVRLFQRASKGVKCTAEGQLLFSYVEKAYEQMELGVAKVRQMQNLELGEIRIGASDMTLRFYLLPYLEQFHREYPDIKVIVTNAPTPETLQILEEGKIDFGIVSAPFRTKPGIQSSPVREIEDIFVAGKGFEAYRGRRIGLAELNALPLVLLEKNTSTRSYLDAFLAQNGIDVQPEFELATSDMIVQFANRNLAVGCVVEDFAEEYLQNGQLFQLQLEKEIPKRHFCLVQNLKTKMPPAAEKLLELLTQM